MSRAISFELAAKSYCALRVAVAEVRRSLEKCEVAELPEYDPGAGMASGGTPACWRQRHGGSDTDENGYLPVEDRCDPCQRNVPRVAELRVLKRKLGSAMATMLRAFKRQCEADVSVGYGPGGER